MSDLFESLFNTGDDFRKAQTLRGTAQTDSRRMENIILFKVLMTLANYHATVSDIYLAKGMMSEASHHRDRVSRYRNDANKFKNA